MIDLSTDRVIGTTGRTIGTIGTIETTGQMIGTTDQSIETTDQTTAPSTAGITPLALVLPTTTPESAHQTVPHHPADAAPHHPQLNPHPEVEPVAKLPNVQGVQHPSEPAHLPSPLLPPPPPKAVMTLPVGPASPTPPLSPPLQDHLPRVPVPASPKPAPNDMPIEATTASAWNALPPTKGETN